ncbi:hypothetical protein E5986_05860 [Adlercreutzia caecimuris]|uniref:Uncharacterized protein n=1 Tax=Adlercreutzia caecimuris TaxID=671266 RepID=A0A4S4G3Q8_9ACTN|nr:hypothetical protein [Adlercreutzia caecimuris]THG37411.1 hypothetical protein E5986_05860 [Adlercreutzia caecimuris]
MGCHCKRYQRVVGDCGQSTVEYAIVAAAFVCVILAGGAVWRMLSSGLVIDHALLSASHHMQGAASWVIDVFSF